MQSYTDIGGSDAVNPTLIAQLASRIYNEVPGASFVPKHESDATQTPAAALGKTESFDALSFAHVPSGEQSEVLSLNGINGIFPHFQIPSDILTSADTTPSAYQSTGLEAGSLSQSTPNAHDLGYYFMQGSNPPAPQTAAQPWTSGVSEVPQQASSGGSPAQARSFVPSWLGDGASLLPVHSHTQATGVAGYENPAAELEKYAGSTAKSPENTFGFIPDLSSHSFAQRGAEQPKCFGQQAFQQANAAAQQGLQLESIFSSFSQLIGVAPQTAQAPSPAASVAPKSQVYVGEDRSLVSTPQIQRYDSFDVHLIRKDFPVLHQQIHGKQLVWFDNAATTQKPQSVIDSIARFYAHDNSNIHRGAHTLAARATDAYEDGREKVRRFIGAASTSEIVFVRGTTEGINLVAQTYGRKFIQAGDEIVVSMLEHHANIVPWQMLAKEKGAIIRVVPINDKGEILMDEYTKLLNPRTRFVALAHANNSLGTVLPIKEMIQQAHKFGARVLIDGAQSVAHTPINLQELDADFFVFSGHKIYSPTGIGVVYGKRELLDIMPPWHGGGNMIRTVTFEETTYNEAPAKFEAGTPNVADTVGLGAALDYVTKIGIQNIAHYEHLLTEYAHEKLAPIPGLTIYGHAKEKVSVVSFVLKNIPTEEVGKLLDQEGIAVRAGHHCAQPSLQRFGLSATVRPSFSFYNTKEEIDRLAAAVRKIVKA